MALRTTLIGSVLVAADAYATQPQPQPTVGPMPGVCQGIDTTQPLTIALEPQWGDYSTCTGQSCAGIVSPVVDAVCAAAGLTCVQTVVPWSTVWDGDIGSGFEDGTFQVAAAARNTGPRGDRCMHFSNPYTAPGSGQIIATQAILDNPPAMDSAVTFCALKGFAIGTDYLMEAKDLYAKWRGAGRGVFSMGYMMTVDDKYMTADELLAAHVAGECHYSLVDAGSVPIGTGAVVVEQVPFEHHRVGGVSFMLDGTNVVAKCVIEKLNAGLDSVRASGFLTENSVGMDVDPVELEATFENPEGCTRDSIPDLSLA